MLIQLEVLTRVVNGLRSDKIYSRSETESNKIMFYPNPKLNPNPIVDVTGSESDPNPKKNQIWNQIQLSLHCT